VESFIGFRNRVSELSKTYRKPFKALKIAEDPGNPREVSNTSEILKQCSATTNSNNSNRHPILRNASPLMHGVRQSPEVLMASYAECVSNSNALSKNKLATENLRGDGAIEA
jgi:hypothetical protein